MEEDRIGSRLTLAVQLGKQYPYVAPAIELQNVTGLSVNERDELVRQLTGRACELAATGSVMMVELVQLTEDFLFDHNRDPKMSAWEQMKAREAEQQLRERQAQEEMARLMGSGSTGLSPTGRSAHDRSSATTPVPADVGGGGAGADVERELQRQRDALEAARRLRMGGEPGLLRRGSSSSFVELESEGGFDDDDDDWFDYKEVGMSSSRYRNDFVELDLLGRGGGGEVVKVKNRLDRRIYAVKKIILESERGRFAKVGALQNRKLRREVTTISRLTHKNIVRYYQAWVEGGTETTDVEPIEEEEEEGKSGEVGEGGEEEEELEEEASEDSGQGWWTNSPTENVLPRYMDRRKSSTSVDEGSSESSIGSKEADENPPLGSSICGLNSESMSDLLQQDNENDFQSPLLTGLGFQNQIYEGVFETTVKHSTVHSSIDTDDDEGWDESSVKVDKHSAGKAILYIQMEYCSTTLRKLIDDRKIASMEENEVWRLVRQTLEALSYLHKRNVIHRDLKVRFVVLSNNSMSFSKPTHHA
jgi:translation initiation factor 2-alpha kinase 4